MAEYLYDLLTTHHLLNKAVYLTQVLLLLYEVLSAHSGSLLGDNEHKTYKHKS